MSDFSDKVSDLLSNPDALAQIMKIAQGLGLGASTPAAGTTATAAPATETTSGPVVQTASFRETENVVKQEAPPQVIPASATPKNEGSGLSSLASLLSGGGSGGLGSLSALSGLLGGSGGVGAGTTDRRIALLNALKPFMKDGKQKKVDNVLSAITISSALGKMRNV